MRMTDQYAVIGNPVAHSKSPQIHAEFARQTSQDLVYKTIFSEPSVFVQTVAEFRAAGGRGMNVTLPFKHDAFALATQRSVRAELAGSVNTLSFSDNGIAADNTDGVGLVGDLTKNLGCNLRGKSVLLMGAGGASYGVMAPLLEQSPDVMVVANRTEQKAQQLAQRFADVAVKAGCKLASSACAALSGRCFDVVINATSAGLTGSMPDLPKKIFADGALAYDMVYGKTTPFMQFAAACGARTSDGLGMLVEQAAESFFIWRGVRPQTAPVMAMLRAAS